MPDDVALIDIHELGALACSRWTCQGTTEISHMYFNGTSLKSLAYNYLIGLDDKGNAKIVFKNNKLINSVCLLTLF